MRKLFGSAPLVLVPALAILFAGPGVNHGTRAEARFHGEYGLWVRQDGNQMHVQWITREPRPGFLTVLAGNQVRHQLTTEAGPVHRASFAAPRSGPVVLRYGATGDPQDQHETTLYPGADTRRARPVFNNVDSVFVVGDVHGEFDNLTQLLRNGGVIDDKLRWAGGRAHLVLLGDLMDRGPDVNRVLWFLYGLEKQAERAGGRVHVVLGNHEIMVFLNDLRYVAPKEQKLAALHGVTYSRLFDIRNTVLGRWLASKPAVIRINDALFAHGGVAPTQRQYSVETLDDSLAAFTREELFYRWADSTATIKIDSVSLARREGFFWGDNSVFWYRGYVQSDTLGNALDQVLRNFRSRVHVVAHTSVPQVQERYNGRLIAVSPPRAASEMLLLTYSKAGNKRYRYGLNRPPTPLASSSQNR